MQLLDDHDIDIYQLLKYFDEAIYREKQFLALTEHFITLESMKRTQDILVLLIKFKKGILTFCRQARLLPLTSRQRLATDYIRQTNALKFLLLAKEFPAVLEELTS